MNELKSWATALLLASTLTLSACVMINRTYEMVALVDGHSVAFTLPKADFADKDIKFMLSGIGVVTKDECSKDCVVWEMVRPIGSNTDLIEENFIKFPIPYGVTLPNMQTRVLTKLRKGTYGATASIAMIKNGKIIDSKRIGAVFTIE